VVVWGAEGSGFSGVPREELERLATYFGAALNERLARDFEIAENAVPGALQIRVAIVEGREPSGSVEAPEAGRIGIEVEILDAVTGERLVAAADTREDLGGELGPGRDGSGARKAFDDWAARIATKLALLRQFDAAQGRTAQ
jgi:hypothetical protein